MEYDHDRQHSPSFRHRIKSKMCCFSSYHEVDPAPSSGSDDEFRRSSFVSKSPSSPSSWIRSRAHEEIKDKCASLFSRIGGRGFRRHSNTSEYRYDPTSYALNFDDETARIDEFPLRDFTSRLPPSPPPYSRFPAAIVGCS